MINKKLIRPKIMSDAFSRNFTEMTEEERKKEIDDIFERNKCSQCHKNSAFGSEVCMSCAKKNQREAMR